MFSLCVGCILGVHKLVRCLFSHFVEIRSIAQPTLVGGVYRTEQYTFSLCGYSTEENEDEQASEVRLCTERSNARECLVSVVDSTHHVAASLWYTELLASCYLTTEQQ